MSTPGGPTWWHTAWAASLVAVGSVGMAGAWHHWLPVAVLVVGAVVPMVVLRLVIGLGVSRWATASVLVLLLTLTAYLMAAQAGTSLRGTLEDAIPLLLTEPRPYPVRADLLVAPLMLTALVSLFAGLRLDGRTRVEPVGGAVVLYVAGALLTTGRSDPWGILAGLLMVLALLGWVLLDEHTEPKRQRIAVSGPAVAVLVGALASLALVPAAHPFEPRTLVDPPVLLVEASSPLPQLCAWAANPDHELLRVRGDAVPLRLVTLDRYDGSQWKAATDYTRLGSIAAPPVAPGDRQRTSTVTVQFDGLGGQWLPSPGYPVSVSEVDALVDPTTGTLYDPAATLDTTYDVTGVVDAPDPSDLVSATVPASHEAARYLKQPDLPFALATYARVVTRRATSAYEQAIDIETAVKNGRRLSAKAISGSALWRIDNFLLGGPGRPGAQIGTSEQFATAFALLARFNGLPTRIVVGFKPGEPQSDGPRIIHGRDAMAWPEVYFTHLGWVPFSPTPRDNTFTRDRPKVSHAPVGDDQSTPAPTTAPNGGAAPADDEPAPAPDRVSAPSGWLPWALGAVVVLPLLLLAAIRRIRTLVHLRRGPTGAWSEVLDALRLAGMSVPPATTAPAIGDHADQSFGITVTRRLAEGAERVAFGPDPRPARRGHASDLRVVRRAARASLPWWRRWWWAFDPRVLGR
ncbi:MAG: putative rane protein [Nocardioides sp.]|nr:putative rane protein [Nocardioides sp.]